MVFAQETVQSFLSYKELFLGTVMTLFGVITTFVLTYRKQRKEEKESEGSERRKDNEDKRSMIAAQTSREESITASFRQILNETFDRHGQEYKMWAEERAGFLSRLEAAEAKNEAQQKELDEVKERMHKITVEHELCNERQKILEAKVKVLEGTKGG